MNAENFTYWAHGFMEIGKPEYLTKLQVQELKNHLELVSKATKSPYQTTYNPIFPSQTEFKGEITC